MIEKEHAMSADYVVKSLPTLRLVARTASLDQEQLGEEIGPMFDAVSAALSHITGALEQPVATYAESEAGMDVVVGYAWAGAAPSGTQVVELEATDAVCGVHLGPVTGLPASWQELHRGAVDNGHEFAGPCREHYVRAEGEDQSDWVIELQQPITRSAG